jgi:transposase
MAIAHKILVAVFHMLGKAVPFQELGEAFLDQQARKRTTTNLVHRLNNLGYESLFAAGTSQAVLARQLL